MDKIRLSKIETRLEVEKQDDVVKLYLYGPIRQAGWWEEDEDVISAKRVLKALEGAGDKKLEVHLNSHGGDVFESIAISNVLKQHKGDVEVVIDGLAASGASLIAMSGDIIKMFPSSMMMIHKAWTWAWGNADELRTEADNLDKIDSAVLASYEARFVGTKEELGDLIKNETWLTAEECKTLGFCDEVADEAEGESESEEPQNSIKESLLAKYQKEPKTEQWSFFNAFNKEKESEV